MIIVDARKFSSSRGALLALQQQVRLMRLAERKVRVLVDKKTHEYVLELQLDNQDFVVVKNMLKFYFYILKLCFTHPKVQIFCPHAVSFFKALPFIPFSDTFYWVQGLVSDEMELRREPKSKIFAMRVFEYVAYKFCTDLIVVSHAMREELALRFSDRCNIYCVPCLPRTRRTSDEKIKESFVYVGGVSAWQRVDSALEFYNRYKDAHPLATLTLATGEQDKAWDLIRCNISSQNISSVNVVTIRSADEMDHFLSKAEFGFLLRDPLPLNKVASPIKFGEYVSCGVTVIISPCVGDFSQMVEEYSAGLVWTGSEKVCQLDSVESNAFKLYEENFNERFYSKVYES